MSKLRHMLCDRINSNQQLTTWTTWTFMSMFYVPTWTRAYSDQQLTVIDRKPCDARNFQNTDPCV